MANHPIVHVEIPATDPQAAGTFYAEAFDWKLQLEEQFNYMMFSTDGGPGGALVQTGSGGGDMGPAYRPGEVRIYFGTDDLEASLAAVEAHGGKTLVPRTAIPGWGWSALFADPFGNTMALFTDRMPADQAAS